MAKKDLETYFNEEMSYLREQGDLFSKKYPHVSSTLNISKYKSKDPHVERLIEAFAFLTAKLQKRHDENLSKIGESIVDVLHPHYSKVKPAFSIAEFTPNSAYTVSIKKNTEIVAPNKSKFKTLMDTQIYPMRLKRTSVQGDFLTLTFSYSKLIKFSKLTLHVQGDKNRAAAIFESLKGGEVYYSFGEEDQSPLKNANFQFFGYNKDETVTASTYDNYSYTLLQDFFFYPEKFLFASLNLDELPKPPNNEFTLWLPYEKGSTEPKNSDFNFSAAPVVNLFEISTDPIVIDHKKSAYPLTISAYKPDDYEIHTILQLKCDEKEIKPFFNKNDTDEFYYSSFKTESLIENILGADTFIRLHSNSQDSLKERKVVYGKVWATNRNRVNEITENDIFTSTIPIPKIKLLQRPHYFPYKADRDFWKLISQLSINHLYFSDNATSLSLLKKILRLNGAHGDLVNLLKSITFKNTANRFTKDGIYGYLRGVEITIEAQIKSTVIILSKVLHKFFSAQVSLNNFVSLKLVDFDTKQEVRSWNAVIGQQKTL
ncbi:MAG: type VI secretion system baseplate subunit TssF [Alphaproteobacteria bacterium]|nr:MAG: type VI secretion system baseplate subunit TssF [Alphaproteobacteria bacterium]